VKGGERELVAISDGEDRITGSCPDAVKGCHGKGRVGTSLQAQFVKQSGESFPLADLSETPQIWRRHTAVHSPHQIAVRNKTNTSPAARRSVDPRPHR
jgi:hypothetical protein